MSQNLKLQSSASKAQARAVELELAGIEAREARELLGIVQPYLPQAYVDSDMDSTSCYLFFVRLGAKTDLISSVVGQAHGIPDSLSGGPVTEQLVGVCEVRFLHTLGLGIR
jgi:dynactin 1